MPENPHVEKIGRVSTKSVEKFTKRSWDEWLALLKDAGADSWTHKEIVAYLRKRYKLSPWWQQGVSMGFEMAIGRRQEGRNLKGEWSLTATKSLPQSAKKIWNFISSPKGMEIWLKPLAPTKIRVSLNFETRDGYYGEFRTLKAFRRVRMTWQDPEWEKKSVLQIHVVDRPKNNCILVFQHEQIADARTQIKLRSKWKAVVTAIEKAILKET